MTVYVDGLFTMKARNSHAYFVGKKNDHQWCHMMADSFDELHAFAARLGLKRAWFQGDHYDLTPGRRLKAVELGAQQVTGRELVELRRRHRSTGGSTP